MVRSLPALACLLLGCNVEPLSSHLDQGSPDAGPPDAGADAAVPDAAVDAAPDTGWELVYSDPLAGLHDIWVASASRVVAVGDDGRIVELDGKVWKARPLDWSTTLLGIWGRSERDMVAVGIDVKATAPVALYHDGTTWTKETGFPAGMYPLTDVWGVGTMLFFSSWAGKVHQHDPTTSPSQPYKKTVSTGGCPALTDPPPTLHGISAQSLEDVLVVGESGLLARRTADKGWIRICHSDPTINHAAVFHLPGTSHYYIGMNYLRLEVMRDLGDQYWVYEDRKLPNAQKLYIRAIWGTGEDVLAVGDQGTVLHTRVNTTTAKKVPFPTRDALRGVMGADRDTVYVCGAGGGGQGGRIWRGRIPEWSSK